MVKKEYINERIRLAIAEATDPDIYRTGPPWGEYDPLYNCILALVLRWEPHYSVLDLGCYLGDFTARLQEVGFEKIVGVDISTEAIKYAKQRHPEITFVASDINDLNFENEFDVVVGSGVLNFNHLTKEEYSQTILKIHSFLRIGGYLIEQNPYSAMKKKESSAFKEMDRYFQLVQHLESIKYGRYAYKDRREHGKRRYIRLHKRRDSVQPEKSCFGLYKGILREVYRNI